MRHLAGTLVAFVALAVAPSFAQQPQFLYAQFTTTTAAHGLNAELDTLKREAATARACSSNK